MVMKLENKMTDFCVPKGKNWDEAKAAHDAKVAAATLAAKPTKKVEKPE